MTRPLNSPRMTLVLLSLLLLIAVQCSSQAQFLPTLRPVLEIWGERYNTGLGGVVVALGDINGDGWPDFGVSAGDSLRMYFGGRGILDDKADASVKGGWNAVFGDVNGDGYKDLITAKYGTNGFDVDTVFIYMGHPGPGLMLNTTPDIAIPGEATPDEFGYFMAVGDLDADGIDDLAVVARGHINVSLSSGGKVYIFLGKQNFTGTPDHTGIMNIHAYYGQGLSISDLNGDGIADLAVGLSHMDHPTDRYHQLLIYHGRPGWIYDADNPDQVLDSRTFPIDDPTRSMLYNPSIFDVNNDGIDDMYVRYVPRTNNKDSIRILIFYGRQDSIRVVPDRELWNPNPQLFNWLLWIAHRINDINNDGFKDYIIRVDNYIDILLFYPGTKTGMSDYPFARYSPGRDPFGESAASVGDINGDGVQDILTGGPGEAFSNFGYAVILSGDTNLVVGAPAPQERVIFSLRGGYPNPFYCHTNFEIDIPDGIPMSITICDLLGRKVRELSMSGTTKMNVEWDGMNDAGEPVPAGMYYVQFQVQAMMRTVKVVLLR